MFLKNGVAFALACYIENVIIVNHEGRPEFKDEMHLDEEERHLLTSKLGPANKSMSFSVVEYLEWWLFDLHLAMFFL